MHMYVQVRRMQGVNNSDLSFAIKDRSKLVKNLLSTSGAIGILLLYVLELVSFFITIQAALQVFLS